MNDHSNRGGHHTRARVAEMTSQAHASLSPVDKHS